MRRMSTMSYSMVSDSGNPGRSVQDGACLRAEGLDSCPRIVVRGKLRRNGLNLIDRNALKGLG